MRTQQANHLSALSPTVRLVTRVERLLAENAKARPVSLSMRLADLGVTSIQMVELMLFVEAEFNLTIPRADITPENFQSIASIAELITKLGAGSDLT
jgi:acyl carrier protein